MWRVVGMAAMGIGVLLVTLAIWGVIIEPRLIDVRRETAALPGLPSAWEGRQVALLADLQIGMWMANTGTARRIVARLVAQPPAAVFIAGDFLYEDSDDLAADIDEAVAIVRPLPAAGIPTFAVLGNHDYSIVAKSDPPHPAMAEHLRNALERAGVRVLENAAVRIPEPLATRQSGDSRETALYVVGIGSNWADTDQPTRAINAVPNGVPYLVLMHNPRSFVDIGPGLAPVALAAHTHGGQIRLPFAPDWTWLTFVRDDPVHADGWTHGGFGAPGNRLYVNRGIGFSYVPVRINCRPELTFLTLHRADRPVPYAHAARTQSARILISNDVAFTQGLAAFGVLVCVQYAATWLQMRSRRVRSRQEQPSVAVLQWTISRRRARPRARHGGMRFVPLHEVTASHRSAT
ncbi:MAG TPA: metallophosphoesterase [Candidatus Polarisedimenticolaceae bacterium]|nr:metallophosphoesterase [Candidatus Polarisedimenticolaceae bacterium]